jgi:hypothetical protein
MEFHLNCHGEFFAFVAALPILGILKMKASVWLAKFRGRR